MSDLFSILVPNDSLKLILKPVGLNLHNINMTLVYIHRIASNIIVDAESRL